jgi:birA, biotin-[acetyl-CoA-carboxylase] ligase region
MKWKRYATEGIASLLFRIFSPGRRSSVR